MLVLMIVPGGGFSEVNIPDRGPEISRWVVLSGGGIGVVVELETDLVILRELVGSGLFGAKFMS